MMIPIEGFVEQIELMMTTLKMSMALANVS